MKVTEVASLLADRINQHGYILRLMHKLWDRAKMEMRQENEALRAQLLAAQADKTRLDWLDAHGIPPRVIMAHNERRPLRAAIDASIWVAKK